MPQAARMTKCVDLTLPLEDIGPALVSLVAPSHGDAQ
jgi:chemotaxis response regulator CheB